MILLWLNSKIVFPISINFDRQSVFRRVNSNAILAYYNCNCMKYKMFKQHINTDLESAVISTDGEKLHQISFNLINLLLWINKKRQKIQLINQSIQKEKRLNYSQAKCKQLQTIFKLMMFAKAIIANFTSTLLIKLLVVK